MKSQSQPQKPINIIEEEEVKDVISALPDCLLTEILSHLDSTKDFIRTSSLSKQWKRVCTNFPALIFSRDDKYCYQSKYSLPLSAFFSAVDQTITRHHQSKLQIFELRTHYDTQFESQVNHWIRYVISCNVEKLILRLWDTYYYDLIGRFVFDQSFFNNFCITHLTLGGCVLNPSGAISWTTLRSLNIKQGKLDEDLIENILSGSRVLETLKLKNCYGYSRVDVTSKSVKNLVISGFSDYDDDIVDAIEINAPNILSLTIKGELALRNLLLLDVSSLVEVDLDFTLKMQSAKEAEHILEGLILCLHHVTELKIGESCCKILYRLEDEGFIRPSHLKVPVVIYSNDDDDSLDLSD